MGVVGEEIEGNVELGRKGKEINQYQESVPGECEEEGRRRGPGCAGVWSTNSTGNAITTIQVAVRCAPWSGYGRPQISDESNVRVQRHPLPLNSRSDSSLDPIYSVGTCITGY